MLACNVGRNVHLTPVHVAPGTTWRDAKAEAAESRNDAALKRFTILCSGRSRALPGSRNDDYQQRLEKVSHNLPLAEKIRGLAAVFVPTLSTHQTTTHRRRFVWFSKPLFHWNPPVRKLHRARTNSRTSRSMPKLTNGYQRH